MATGKFASRMAIGGRSDAIILRVIMLQQIDKLEAEPAQSTAWARTLRTETMQESNGANRGFSSQQLLQILLNMSWHIAGVEGNVLVLQ